MACVEEAMEFQESLEEQGYDMEFANDVASDFYEACESVIIE